MTADVTPPRDVEHFCAWLDRTSEATPVTIDRIKRVARGESQAAVAREAGVTPPTIGSKWRMTLERYNVYLAALNDPDSVDRLDLSVRARSALRCENIRTIPELVAYGFGDRVRSPGDGRWRSKAELIPNCGKKTAAELITLSNNLKAQRDAS